MKETKEIEKGLKKKKGVIHNGESQMESASKYSPNKGEVFDREMDDEEALKHIELPEETLYLIDKVVR